MALDVVLVMPAYNEEECIQQVVDSWNSELSGIFGNKFGMVVVNDGSKDNTGKILDELAQTRSWLKVVHQPNGGHGKALLHAYRVGLELNSQFIFQTDSDNQFNPSDFKKLWNQRNVSRFILGYRLNRHDAFHRLVITRILRAVLFLTYGRYIVDANIPFRLIESSYLRKLLTVLAGEPFAPNIFLSVLAARDGENLLSIPVDHIDRQTGTVSIVRWKLIKVCLQSLRELIEFRKSLSSSISKLHSNK